MGGSHHQHDHTDGELDQEQASYHSVYSPVTTQCQEVQVVDMRHHKRYTCTNVDVYVIHVARSPR